MKKKILINILALFVLGSYVFYKWYSEGWNKELASDKATLFKCVDGDTAIFLINGSEEKVRFLSVDAPETVKLGTPVQAYGKEASTYTCNALNSASEIRLEYEKENDRDKYDRLLAWIFVDDELLQLKLIDEGLASIKYEKTSYKYLGILRSGEAVAQKNKKGIWKNDK